MWNANSAPGAQIPASAMKCDVDLGQVHKEKLNTIDTVYEKHIFSLSRPSFCGNLTWRNLKGLVELANLTVKLTIFFVIKNYDMQGCVHKTHIRCFFMLFFFIL